MLHYLPAEEKEQAGAQAPYTPHSFPLKLGGRDPVTNDQASPSVGEGGLSAASGPSGAPSSGGAHCISLERVTAACTRVIQSRASCSESASRSHVRSGLCCCGRDPGLEGEVGWGT